MLTNKLILKCKSISRSFTLFLLLINSIVYCQPVIFPKPLSPRIANYNIDVKLDVNKRLLDANETIIWFNKTTDRISEMQFHLYLNAFRNNKSTFMKESGGMGRGFKIEKDGWGFSEIKKIKLSSGEDLTGQMQFIQPDDDNIDDKTVFRIKLPKPLNPGDSIKLNIDFIALLPEPPFARSGAKEEYFFVGQWFPKVGVYIDGKWNCHQYHANSEFFADFGVYNVNITVPEKNIVGATGIQTGIRKNNDGTATHTYHAEDVHDFAWTTSPEFVEFKGKAQDVDIRVLMQPDHADQGIRHLEAAKIAVEYFQNWYGDYPYPNLTVVDPRRGAGGSGGMEYPTLITAGTIYGLPAGVRTAEMVIIHEFGHNYWYHLVASNEFEESWLDEGINTYTENQIIESAYGTNGNFIDIFGIKINDIQFQHLQYSSITDLDPTVRYSWKYYSGGSYGVNSYMKPSLFLTTLQNFVGKETMFKIIRTYSEKWRFKHPKSQDFIDVANEIYSTSPPSKDEANYSKASLNTTNNIDGTRQNLDWFFNQALYTNSVLDYSVDAVSSKLLMENQGFDFNRAIKDALDGTEFKAENENDEDSSKIYLSEVKVRRLGSFIFPVEIEVVFENGEKIREHWDGKELWIKYRYTKNSKLVSATVDPDHKIPLDINYSNNGKTLEAQTLSVTKLSARILFWTQFILDMPEFLHLFTFFNYFL
ncbi:MAG: M1 family metallopeptidase [Ignavibacteriales bacterium]|nr:M1 family metallopeptidase [Ignavibacteriales bacterium]